ncbi:ATPase associated with various cellular activities (AAA) family protein [Babesia bovis T2Bo]|uniref:ATPase AAA-type core domain-containing protein n=1 Tax=Babesia bovis TaxID=5865 RepID=A7ATE6_BABBO|nr:ATPase associated with various cellular activities (AAA) family protein [Babesia bovis T2Bo]EDO06207.1 ATPase associated with various cellular activities (AAA) family protein [Babesia bovis T2Bo]|eukprot:XP_001609775.1 hypothetical protein [Babesia bovis T2Bo]
MGTFVAIEGARDDFKRLIYDAVVSTGYPSCVITLKTLRRIVPKDDPAKSIIYKIEDLVSRLIDKREAVVILDEFDVWEHLKNTKGRQEENQLESSDGQHRHPYTKGELKGTLKIKLWENHKSKLVSEKNVYEKIEKTKLSWVYGLLYLFKHSLASKLSHDGCKLIFIGLYAHSAHSKAFYGDIFDNTLKPSEFIKQSEHLFIKNLGLPEDTKEKSEDKVDIIQALELIDAVTANHSIKRIESNDLYLNQSKTLERNNILHVPFEVKCRGICLSNITLICGKKQSGKTTLLNAIIKAWVQGDPITIINRVDHQAGSTPNCKHRYIYAEINSNCDALRCDNVDDVMLNEARGKPNGLVNNRMLYKLEYYDIFSQYVGCGESYIRHTFQKAKSNQPALIVLDQLELLFGNANDCREDWSGLETIARTLINELNEIDEQIAFVGATSGHMMPQDLPNVLTNVSGTTVVMMR